jgi:alpha-tubulin suppressor-like RCC1 family protein
MSNHNCIYKANGELHVFGDNRFGQLGLGNCDENMSNVLMINNDIKTICCGLRHTLIYKYGLGELYIFGSNEYGQLGLGDFQNRNIPTLLMTDKNIKSVHCGERHTLIYKTTGELYVFGCNRHYELGLGDYINRCVPTLLMLDKSIKNISCGASHSLIHKRNGEIYVFGCNDEGQLGLGNTNDQCIPTLLMTDINIESIHCGVFHSFIYKRTCDGIAKLYGFGYNKYGQLGLGDRINRNIPTLILTDKNIKNIHCAGFHTVIYKNDGKIYVFGRGEDGELGLDDRKNRHLPTLFSDTNIVTEDIRQIICGYRHTLIYKNNGELYGFGRNTLRQLSLNGTLSYIRPKLLLTDENILMINEIIIPPIQWEVGIYPTLSYVKKQEILLFLFVCFRFRHRVKLPKDPKNCIISFLF